MRPHFPHDTHEDVHVGEVAVVQEEALLVRVGGVNQVIQPLLVVAAGPPLDPVHDVALIEQQLREVGAVLAGDAGDDGDLAGGVAAEAVGRGEGGAANDNGIFELGAGAGGGGLGGGGSHRKALPARGNLQAHTGK